MKLGKYHKKQRMRSELKRFLNGLITGALTIMLVLSFVAPAYAETGRIDFLDVSHYQSESGLPLSVYQTAKAGHIDGVVVKVSEGTSRRDNAAAVNIANARAAGLRVSAYHFGRLTSVSEAKQEAQWFDKNLQANGFDKDKDGYVVLDLEAANLTKNKAALTSYANAFIAELHALGYDRTDVYTGRSYYTSRLDVSKLDNSQPWLARYAADGKTVLDPGNDRGAHQWSSRQRPFPGFGYFDVNIDYAGKYTGAVSSKVGKIGNVSLVNYLSSKKIDKSFANRAKLAVVYGIVTKVSEYHGTTAQNIALLANIKAGKKVSKKAQAAIKKSAVKAPAKTSVLKLGSRGSAVKAMQQRLASVFFYPDKGARNNGIDGIYGNKTANAVKRFQLAHRLTADGIYGSKTAAELSKATAKKAATNRASVKKPYIIKKGDSLWSIAHEKKTTVKVLKSKNGLKSDTIYPGQKLKY